MDCTDTFSCVRAHLSRLYIGMYVLDYMAVKAQVSLMPPSWPFPALLHVFGKRGNLTFHTYALCSGGSAVTINSPSTVCGVQFYLSLIMLHCTELNNFPLHWANQFSMHWANPCFTALSYLPLQWVNNMFHPTEQFMFHCAKLNNVPFHWAVFNPLQRSNPCSAATSYFMFHCTEPFDVPLQS